MSSITLPPLSKSNEKSKEKLEPRNCSYKLDGTKVSSTLEGFLCWNPSLLYYYYVGPIRSNCTTCEYKLLRNISEDKDRTMYRFQRSIEKKMKKSSASGNDFGAEACSPAPSDNGDASPGIKIYASTSSTTSSASNTSSIGSKGSSKTSSLKLFRVAKEQPLLSTFVEETQSLGRQGGKKATRKLGLPLAKAKTESVTSDTENFGDTVSISVSTKSVNSGSKGVSVLRQSFRSAKSLFLPFSKDSALHNPKKRTIQKTKSVECKLLRSSASDVSKFPYEVEFELDDDKDNAEFTYNDESNLQLNESTNSVSGEKPLSIKTKKSRSSKFLFLKSFKTQPRCNLVPKPRKTLGDDRASQEIINFDSEPKVRHSNSSLSTTKSSKELCCEHTEIEISPHRMETEKVDEKKTSLDPEPDKLSDHESDPEKNKSLTSGDKKSIVSSSTTEEISLSDSERKKSWSQVVVVARSVKSDEKVMVDPELDLDEVGKDAMTDTSSKSDTKDEENGLSDFQKPTSPTPTKSKEIIHGSSERTQETDEEPSYSQSFRQLKPFDYPPDTEFEGKRERLYKVLVVGELGSGKTSIIKRYVHQFFSQHYRATIGVDFALKVLRWDGDTVVRLQLWDIAGQERFGSMTRVYYKEAVGAFVVFDVTRTATLEAVPKWKADLDSKVALPDGQPIPTVLLANKSDLPKEGMAFSREKMNDFCQQQGFSAWFETSAKENINIDESANFLVSKILEMDRWSQEPQMTDPDKVELSANGKHKPNSSSSCAC